jgi:DNA primase
VTAAAALGLRAARGKFHCFNGRDHRRGEDRTPSLVLYPADGRFKCFGCGVGGDVIDLVRGVLGVSFREAVAWITELAGGRGPAIPAGVAVCQPRQAGLDRAAEVYHALSDLTALPEPGSPAGDYLLQRGIDPGTASAVGAREVAHVPSVWFSLLGKFGEDQVRDAGLVSRQGNFLFAHHHLLLFYLDGAKPVFVQARDVTGTAAAKELRPSGLPCPLPYNANALRGPPPRVYVCEGCIDTLSALQLGYPAVGVPGVQSFRDEWFPRFRAVPQVYVVFDNDEAGRRGGAELCARFRLHGFRVEVVHPPVGKDVNDFLVACRKGEEPT